jgi:Calcineurin-like phosphoesterase
MNVTRHPRKESAVMTTSRHESSVPHIQVVPENRKGDDQVIGDIHGNAIIFKKWIADLGPNDRAFCVGDYVDRGDDSLGVIEAIVANNKNPAKPKIYCARGNHESFCLDAIEHLERLAPFIDDRLNTVERLTPEIVDALSEELREYSEKINLHASNGGAWLSALMIREIASARIKVAIDGTLTYSEDSKIKMVKDFMGSLPYIIHVTGLRPFNIVHADMPFNDDELHKRIKYDLPLTEDEIYYTIFARENSRHNEDDLHIVDKGRTKFSSITYCGHSIIGLSAESCLRAETNTVDLDFCMVTQNAALVANHTLGVCKWIGESPLDFYRNEGKRALQHLYDQFKLEHLLIAAKRCKTRDELARVIATSECTDLGVENVEELLRNYGACQDGGHSHTMFKHTGEIENEHKPDSTLAR